MYPVIIVWEEPSGRLRFTTTAQRPHVGENEGQFVDRIALGAITAMGDVDPAWRRPNLPLARILASKQSFRPTWARDVYFPIGDEDPSGLSPEVRIRECLRLVNGFVLPGPALLRAEYVRLLRLARNARLRGADGPWIRAMQQGQPLVAQAWATYAQQLRDLPALVQADLAAMTTPEELEAYQPPWPTPPA